MAAAPSNTQTPEPKPTLKKRVQHFVHFLMYDIWRIRDNELTSSRRYYIRFIKKLIMSMRGFIYDNLMVKAAGLTFYTMMAIVPIFALLVVIGRGFGFQENIDLFINETFGAQPEIATYIRQFVNNYIEHASGGVFVGIGAALLLWSVLSAFRQIESNFNQIWNVKKSRSLLSQFTTYISLLILVPILIALASGFSYYIHQRMSSVLGDLYSPLSNFAWQLLPYLFYWLLFMLIYLIIPNTRVKFKHALLGGIITGTLFQLFQALYLSGQINLTKYNAVYGGFAAIPLLLFWLQMSWTIVLYGAEFCYVSQNLKEYNFEREIDNISRRYKDYILLVVMKIIIQRFERDEPPITTEQLSDRYNIPIRLLHDVLKQLIDIGFVIEQHTDHHTEKHFFPAFDINKMSLGLFYERIDNHGSENFKIDPQGEFSSIWNQITNMKQAIEESSDKILIKDI